MDTQLPRLGSSYQAKQLCSHMLAGSARLCCARNHQATMLLTIGAFKINHLLTRLKERWTVVSSGRTSFWGSARKLASKLLG
jgi:hypothetical protein